jgi:hypothetical protein
VILPGFGCFLTNYSGARIHPIKHSFHPPSRTVIFNANLSTNDGLLIDHICRIESISYKDASLKVNNYVAQCFREMQAGNTIVLTNIGSCRMGKENNIIFDPDINNNYLADAFGLPSFVSPAIKRESVRARLEKQLTPKQDKASRKKRDPIPFIGWAAGISIPVAAALLLYFYSPGFLHKMGNSYASFVPTVKFTEAKHDPIEVSEKTARFNNIRVLPEEKAEAVIEEPKPDEVHVKPVIVLKKYQVVVGAFSEHTNAVHYMEELRARELQASIVGKSKSGLTRVSIDGSDNKKEALHILAQVREDVNANAWLLRIR